MSRCFGCWPAIVAAVAMFAANGAAAPASRKAGRPPNIVFILVDDLGPEQLGCYGGTNATPNIDRLAREGMRFRTCYTVPVCSPSRVLLLTGRYGFRTGWFNFTGRPGSPTATNPDYDLGTSEQTFAHVLKAAGYATGLAGRWLEYGHEHRQIPSAGFDEYHVWAIYGDRLPDGARHTGAWENANLKVTARYWQPCVVADGRYVPTKPDDYGPHLTNAYACEFVRRHHDEPFLFFYPMVLVHDPYHDVPDRAKPGGRKRGNLQEFVEQADALVGRFLAELDRNGLRENTVVFLAGDNGTHRRGKNTPTEKGARVPLIVRAPGLVAPGVVTDALTDFSDMLPTLAELAGAKPRPGVALDGHSLMPLLRGERAAHRDWIFSYLERARVLRDRRWLLEGDGRFFDCGDDRDGPYRDVTASTDSEVRRARQRFEEILRALPGY